MNSIADEELRGKRLLILGANEESKVFVERAHELGIYTIVTDHIINSPAKKIADKYYDINGKNVNELVKVARSEMIDGVILGVADPLTVSYMELAIKLELPCYISPSNIEFFINKEFFINMCKEEGIATVERYFVGKEFENIPVEKIVYPCILKPSKGRGGKGVMLCNKYEELYSGFLLSRKYSDNNDVIIEKYVDYKDVVVDYFFHDGKFELIGLSDRVSLCEKRHISPVTYANISPSVLTKAFIEQCHKKFINIFRKLDIQNGFLEMQVFWDGSTFYPYDTACIVSGESSGPIYNELYNIDFAKCAIEYALTGRMKNYRRDLQPRIADNKVGMSIWILLRPGIISRINGLSEIQNMPEVLKFMQRLYVGDEVTREMYETEKATFARIWICAETRMQLENIEKRIRKNIGVYDKNDTSLIMELEN